MNKFLGFCLNFWLIQSIYTECDVGCLKCNTITNKCLFCDLSTNYFLSFGNCIQIYLNNCLYYDFQGRCIECENVCFPDSSGFCILITEPINNCAVASSHFSCQYCVTGYYLQNNSCIPVFYTIDFCFYYSADGICARCQPGFYLYIDGSSCLQISDKTTCLIYSQIRCQNCTSGFINDKNHYFSLFIDLDGNLTSDFIALYQSILYQSFVFPIKTCRKGGVLNCKEFNEQNICLVCLSGFILQNNNCIKPPKQHVINCIALDINENCYECANGFTLSNGICVFQGFISNCDRHNNSSPILTCLECSRNFYLQFNFCLQRFYSINDQNCIELDLFNDQCLKCQTGYDLLENYPNICIPAYFSQNTLDFNYIQKIDCQIGSRFNPNDSTCIPGIVPNCDQYKIDSNECVVCQNGYYLNSLLGKCFPHIFRSSRDCQIWSQTEPNFCVKCPSNFLRFENVNSCNPVIKPIKNCLIYSNEDSCKICQPGFIFDSIKKSCILSNIFGCLQIYNGLCSQCGSYIDPVLNFSMNYVLSVDFTKCLPQETVWIKHCHSLIEVDGVQVCYSCQKNYYPNFLPYWKTICLNVDSYKLSSPNISQNIANCALFGLSNNGCFICNEGYVLFNNQCILTCPPQKIMTLENVIRDWENNRLYINNRNYCSTATVSYCKTMATSLVTADFTYTGQIVTGCVECLPNSWPVFYFPRSYPGMTTLHTSDKSYISPKTRYPFIDVCLLKTNIDNSLIPGASSLNCKYFIEFNQTLACLSCIFGFTGIVLYSPNFFYINSCVPMFDCDITTKIPGLGGLDHQTRLSGIYSSPLTMYFSCDSCLDQTKIPIAELSQGNLTSNPIFNPLTGSLSTWNINSNPPTIGSGFNQTMCFSPQSSWNLPSNCGAALVISDVNNIPICQACKPGFYPILDPNNNLILSCVESENCLSTQFNGCLDCLPNYAISFDVNIGIINSFTCHNVGPFNNCFSGFLDKFNNFVCVICNTGYFINHDGFCDFVSISNCNETSFYINFLASNYTAALKAPLEILLFYPTGGCASCLLNHQLVFEVFLFQICVQNSFLIQYKIVSSTFFSTNCNNTLFNNQDFTIGCFDCINDDFIAHNGVCYPKISTITNPKLQNCRVYDKISQRCLLCQDTFYSNGGICFQGSIMNCQKYSSSTSCLTCYPNFIQMTDIQGNIICFENHISLNCLKWDANSLLNGQLLCQECAPGNYNTTHYLEMPSYSCILYSVIQNCDSYNIQEFSIFATKKECLKCQTGFYLSSNTCFQNPIIPMCVEYSLNQPICLSCEKNYVPINNGKNCSLLYIISSYILNCLNVTFDQKCLTCSPNFYNIDDQCLPVDQKNIIFNCEFYSTNQLCSKCIFGWFVYNNTCILPFAQNCLTFASINACQSCPDGFGLEIVENNVDCNPMDIDFCLEFNTTKIRPWVCLKCKNMYFFDFKTEKCELVISPIIDCIQYKNGYSCLICKKGKILSSDETFCYNDFSIVSQLDQNCEISSITDEATCTICSFGLVFVNGSCVPSRCAFQQGCMFCISETNLTCAICKTGYFMDKTGLCRAIEMNLAQILSCFFLFQAFLIIY